MVPALASPSLASTWNFMLSIPVADAPPQPIANHRRNHFENGVRAAAFAV
jgi:hypothetical protein